MVGDYDKGHAEDVGFEIADGPDHCQPLAVGGGVSPFRGLQRARGEGDRESDVGLGFLCQGGSNPDLTGVGLDVEQLGPIGESEQRSGGQDSEQAGEGVLLLWPPGEGGASSDEAEEWVGDPRAPRDKAAIEIHGAQEAAYFLGGGG